MKEICEVRILEPYASEIFNSGEGRMIGSDIRLIKIETSDPIFDHIKRLDRKVWRGGRIAVTSWRMRRQYSDAEYAEAELLLLHVATVFEPAGEESGTPYDEAKACSICGFGGSQLDSLRLPLSRLPKSKDIARTIAGEIVVSRKFAAGFKTARLTGPRFGDVVSPSGRVDENWVQLFAEPLVEVSERTATGINPADVDKLNQHRCPRHHVLGLNRLSELVVKRPKSTLPDLCATKQAFGIREGLLRPERALITSQRFLRFALELPVKGGEFEVVRFSVK